MSRIRVGPKRRPFPLKLSDDDREMLAFICRQQGVTQNYFVTKALRLAMETEQLMTTAGAYLKSRERFRKQNEIGIGTQSQ